MTSKPPIRLSLFARMGKVYVYYILRLFEGFKHLFLGMRIECQSAVE